MSFLRRIGSGSVLAGVLFFAAGLFFPGVSFADSVYLKNGQVIRTPTTYVIEGDRLVIEQFGSRVTIPLAIVERIVEDDLTGPERSEPRTRVLPPDRVDSPELRRGGDRPATAATSGRAVDQAPAEQTREFWQERVRAIYDEQAELELQLFQLRREEAAFLFSHRSMSYTRRIIRGVEDRLAELERAVPELRREAMRAGAPPGWLRLPYMETRERRSGREEDLFERYHRLRLQSPSRNTMGSERRR